MQRFNHLKSTALAAIAVICAVLTLVVSPAFAEGFENIVLSVEKDSDKMQIVFAPDTPVIYLTAHMNAHVKAGSKVTATWISIDSGGAAPANYKIDEVSFDVGRFDNVLNASLSKPTAGWPKGTYKVDLQVNGKVEDSVGFSVQ